MLMEVRQSIFAFQKYLVDQEIELRGPFDSAALDCVRKIWDSHVIFGNLLDFKDSSKGVVVDKP